jgi:uncharacterized membrane protein YedE/YeeE
MTVTPFTPLESLAGGALIGASAVLLLLTTGRLAGISGIVRRLLPPYAASAPLEAAAFIAALFASPFVWTLATGGPVHQTVTPASVGSPVFRAAPSWQRLCSWRRPLQPSMRCGM